MHEDTFIIGLRFQNCGAMGMGNGNNLKPAVGFRCWGLVCCTYLLGFLPIDRGLRLAHRLLDALAGATLLFLVDQAETRLFFFYYYFLSEANKISLTRSEVQTQTK